MDTHDPRMITPEVSAAETVLPEVLVPDELVAADSGSRDVAEPELCLRLRRPSSTVLVFHLAGDLDVSTAPYLHDLLAPRLLSASTVVVVDCVRLRFLGLTGVEVLALAHHHSEQRGTAFGIVAGPVCVVRALRAAGLTDVIPTFPTWATAVAGLSTSRDEESGHVTV